MPRNCDSFSLLMSDILDRARRERGMTQATLAERAGIYQGNLSHLLDGSSARTSSYARVLDALGVEAVVTLRPSATAAGPSRVQ